MSIVNDCAFPHFISRLSESAEAEGFIVSSESSEPVKTEHFRRGVSRAVKYLEEGLTVPFIARYRQDESDRMSSSFLFRLQREFFSFSEVVKVREKRLAKLHARPIGEGPRLTPAIETMMNMCVDMEELDELWKPLAGTKATPKAELIAAMGLESAAAAMLYDGLIAHVYYPGNASTEGNKNGKGFCDTRQPHWDQKR